MRPGRASGGEVTARASRGELAIWGYALSYLPAICRARATKARPSACPRHVGHQQFELLPATSLASLVAYSPSSAPWAGGARCASTLWGGAFLAEPLDVPPGVHRRHHRHHHAAYTFNGVSIVFMMLLMRAALLINSADDFASAAQITLDISGRPGARSAPCRRIPRRQQELISHDRSAGVDVVIYLCYFVRLRFAEPPGRATIENATSVSSSGRCLHPAVVLVLGGARSGPTDT